MLYFKRKFVQNYYKEDGNLQWTGIDFPEEVVYAEGITLVDITKDVHNIGEGTNLYNPNSYRENDGGYDLDAISVYSADPMISMEDGGSDSATGYGDRILDKGTWFMYNTYDKEDEGTHTFDIQAGNPKGGVNKIGECNVTDNGDGTYTANYDMNDTIVIDGYKYKIVVTDEHLGISDGKFKAVPGADDNQDFGVAFEEEDGKFNIFAHFSVEYKAYINYVQNQAE